MANHGYPWLSVKKIIKIDLFQKVAGVVLDFMAIIWGHGNGFFRRWKNWKQIGFSKCRFDHFRGPNRRILCQGIGQNLIWTIFEKVQIFVFFQLFGKTSKNHRFFLWFFYIPNSPDAAVWPYKVTLPNHTQTLGAMERDEISYKTRTQSTPTMDIHG